MEISFFHTIQKNWKNFATRLGNPKNILTFAILNMVSVVQLVERQIVVLVVVGSSPTVHPSKKVGFKSGLFCFAVASKMLYL